MATQVIVQIQKLCHGYFMKRKGDIADEEKMKLLPKSRNNGRGNEITICKVQIFQPFPDCPNKIHRIQIFLVVKIQCEDRTQSTSFGVPEIS